MTTIEKLLVLQDRDRKIRQLTKETVDIPARKQLIEQRIKGQKDAVQAANDELKRNSAGIKEVELEIDTKKAKILKLREQQGQIKTNQEYKAIENEVGSLQKQIREVEEREIELMEAAELIRARLADAEQILKREQAVISTDMGALDARLQNIQAEIEQVKVDREKVIPDIDADWLARYQRILKHTGDSALVPVDNGSCGGCHMRLPPQQVQDAKRATAMVHCSFCGRLLYAPTYT